MALSWKDVWEDGHGTALLPQWRSIPIFMQKTMYELEIFICSKISRFLIFLVNMSDFGAFCVGETVPNRMRACCGYDHFRWFLYYIFQLDLEGLSQLHLRIKGFVRV